jgi:adenine phosphoribosyltransferase
MEEKEENHQSDIDIICNSIRKIPDFPKHGILFYDIFSLLKDVSLTQKLFNISEGLIKKFCKKNNTVINAIVGLESRGFLLGIVLADRLKLPFVAIRKKNKLPGGVFKINYTTEYSSESFELQEGVLEPNSNVLLVDDLLATGGSLNAAEKLITTAGCKTVAYFVIFVISALKGSEKLDYPENLISMANIA